MRDDSLPREDLRALFSGKGALPRCVALVGGGGKTTLLYALAKGVLGCGERVLCTTTTRMFPPEPEQARLLLTEDESVQLDAIENEAVPTLVARCRLPDGKLSGLSPEAVRHLGCVFSGIVLVEADGAARRPLKAPAEHEPVLPPHVGCCIAVVGMDCVGMPLDDAHVHRAALVCARTGQAPGTSVDFRTLALLAASPEGLFRAVPPGCRRIVFCNKAESPERLAQAEAAARFWAGLSSGAPCEWYAGSAAQNWCLRLLAVSPAVL